MKDLFYYSIFAVILYFVLIQVFDNFTLEQENFDPSLVPVSSIVTLAKVAQKLVNGNGTLTNPGNLQIGSSASAPGNLMVTGNANINGTLTLGGTDIGRYVIDKINALSASNTITTQIAPLIAKNTELTKQITDLQAVVNDFNKRSGIVTIVGVNNPITISFSTIKSTSIIIYTPTTFNTAIGYQASVKVSIDLTIQPGSGFTFNIVMGNPSDVPPIKWFVAGI